MEKNFEGLCFVNLSDFDSLYGHKRNAEGYAKAIEELDVEIAKMNNTSIELNEEGIISDKEIINVPIEENTSRYKEYYDIYKLDIKNIINSLLEKINNIDLLNDEKQIILLSLKNYFKSLEHLEILKQNNEHYDSVFTK